MNRSKSLKYQQVSVKSFPSAMIRSMKHYIQPTLEENQPDKILLHVGTNKTTQKEQLELQQNNTIHLKIFTKYLKTVIMKF